MSSVTLETDLRVATSPTRLKAGCFLLLLLLSGFCGISYEILYGRILGNLVGDQFAVSAAILLTFLLGIGVGMLYAHRLWRFLWLLEAGIGLCAVGFALGNTTLDRWLYASSPMLGTGLGSTLAVCFLLLSLPAFLIGCSLPLFAGYLSRFSSGQVFALAYMVYNFGAAVTALLIEFWLLRLFGLRNTTLCIASLNGLVAIGLLAGFLDLRAARPAPGGRVRFPVRHLVALALASVASAVFQLLMVKVAECVFGPFRETFALVLVVVFLGIALGSAITGRWRLRFSHMIVASLAGLAWLAGGFGWVTWLYSGAYTATVDDYWLCVFVKIATLTVLMGVPAVTFGATIPALLSDQRNVARESGQLLFVSSVANAFGFLLMAFFLHRYFDYGVLIVIIAAMAGAGLMVYFGFRPARWLGVAALLSVVAGLQQTRWDENLLYLSHAAFHSPKALDQARREMKSSDRFKGNQDIFSINWNGDNPHFFINGYVSFPLNSASERLVGAFSALFAPRTDRALVLGLGSGASAGSICLAFDRVDAVEINPAVVENLYRMAAWNFDIESLPSLHKVLDDAIHFTKASHEHYSLILNTVTSPIYFSSSKLYTRDFLEVVRQRLTPDGIYITWVDSRIGDRGFDIILKTLSQSFRDCWVGAIKSTYFLLICSQQKIRVHQPRLIADNAVLADFVYRQNGLRPDWMPYTVVSTRGFDLVHDAQAPVNTLDYPALEFEMARLRSRGLKEFLARLSGKMSVAEVAASLKPFMPFDPVRLVLHNELMLGDATITDRWTKLVSQQTPDFEKHYGLAKLEYHAGYAQAANTADAHHKYGYQLLRQGRYPEAIGEFKKALALNPKRNNTCFNIGACYERMGQLELAITSYSQERAVDPRDEDVPFRLGRVYYKLKKYAESLLWLDTALTLSDEAQTHLYRGLVFEAMGSLDQARAEFGKAAKMAPQDHEIREALARLVSPARR
ncbi:MAG: tetratricopeptide repeat protein [Verrucomicrobia bacterium]|nr:tetratricopeptide repeat protein [Verrucomicrobiota bacterium]